MAEGLFILTIIFVAYVVYAVVDEKKATSKPAVPQAKPDVPQAPPETTPPEAVAKIETPPPVKPASIKKPTPAPIAKSPAKKGLRDPKTGDVATTYSNYRFTKRWIKDALVSEGLLEKVYKNNELDAAAEAAIKAAIAKLEAIEKYQP